MIDHGSSCDYRRPTVLLLGGFGRSGSTLLERMLGQLPGVQTMGEVLHLWERGLRDDELCGCGVPFSVCPFWSAVGVAAFDGWERVDAEQSIADRRDVVSNWHLIGILTGFCPRQRGMRQQRMLRRLDLLYSAVSAETASQVLVDSSKHPAYAFLLRRAEVDLACVLVVRDPRGVVFSWGKEIARPETLGRPSLMPTYGVVPATLRWVLYNWLYVLLGQLGVPLLVVRYEDLVSSPAATIGRLAAAVGVPTTPASLPHGNRVWLDPHHTVAGNPMRFRTGELALRLDEEWKVALPRWRRRIVDGLTLVSRRRFGYGEWPRSPARAG